MSTAHAAAWVEPFLEFHLLPGNEGKRIVLINPWGSFTTQAVTKPRATRPRGIQKELEYWDALVAELARDYRVWQVGFLNDSALVGCEYFFLQSRSKATVRKVRELLSAASAWIGPHDALAPEAEKAGLRVLRAGPGAIKTSSIRGILTGL